MEPLPAMTEYSMEVTASGLKPVRWEMALMAAWPSGESWGMGAPEVVRSAGAEGRRRVGVGACSTTACGQFPDTLERGRRRAAMPPKRRPPSAA
ncbi:hypothetical protein XFLAVUS301_38070 [Xanthobacter flavus]|uniref:Uncharacterized protein n=1 Tax=Xanthobacter flavus TaxID=281 RepID=A0A9W6CKK6_XANFL|nr:hypothetical protein XFLAVUS301_38070 [Xanthobacter flavus]